MALPGHNKGKYNAASCLIKAYVEPKVLYTEENLEKLGHLEQDAISHLLLVNLQKVGGDRTSHMIQILTSKTPHTSLV
jgi:hypothetical protein